jgi:hypothetical protein
LAERFGIGGRRPEDDRKVAQLAFVLLSEAVLPNPEQVALALSTMPGRGETLRAEPAEDKDHRQGFTLRLSTGDTSFVVLMPVAVPNSEADRGAQYSLSSFRDQWRLPPHHAHLLVTFQGSSLAPPIVRLSRFTSLVAAVVKSSPSVGVYWGRAGATHDSEFFVSVAEDPDITLRVMVWSGVSVAHEEDGRLSLLSLGMKQLDQPDLLLVAGESSAADALATMFDMLSYAAERGAPPADGDTVGRTQDEIIPVRYVQSPIEPSEKVWRIEFP